MAKFPKVLCITCAEKILKKVHFAPKYFNNIKKKREEEKKERRKKREKERERERERERKRE